MSIEEMIALYGDEILRLCVLYLGDRRLAEDAFQETFIKAWRQAHTFRGESSMKTWLSHIAVNTCRDTLRSGWLRMMKKSEPIEKLMDLSSSELEQDTTVRDAVLRLPGKYREIVVLYYYQEMKIREIAQALRLPVNTVSTRLRRARALLCGMLSEEVDA